MNVTDMKVFHSQYGDGVITDQTLSTLTVRFSEEYGEKRFLYPSAFESFLTLNNPAMKEKMEAELNAIREHFEAGRRQREEEAELRRNEERRTLLETKTLRRKNVLLQRKLRKRQRYQEISEIAGDDDGIEH